MVTVPKMPNTPEVRFGADGEYSLNGGINLLRQESALPLNQASNILNLNADDRGTLSKCKGLANLTPQKEAIFGINDIALSKRVATTLPKLSDLVLYTNLVSNGDFSNGTTGWTTNFTLDTTIYKYGIQSLKYVNSGSTGSILQQITGANGDKYYMSAWVYLQANPGGINTAIYISAGNLAQTVILGSAYCIPTTIGSWQKLSTIVTGYAGDLGFYFRMYSYNDICTVNADGIMVINLTSLFGKGNEPTQAWCDANIPFTVTTGNTLDTGWTLVTDKSNLNFSTSSASNKLALLCEMDLTSFCTANFASVNADMEAKFYTVLNNIIASSTGALGTGYDTYVYNYNTTVFELLTTFTTNHISSANKVDLMFYPKYASDGVIPCTMNISSYSFKLTFLSLGTGGCTSITYKGKLIVQWSTFLYSYNLDGSGQTQIYSGLANSKAFFIVFQGLLYMFNGTDFIQYDGATCQAVQPYIPIVSQARKPDGTVSTLYEPLNLLTGGFTDMFSPNDGTTKTYTMSFKGLDAILVTATVNGVAKAETTDFTVDRVNGIITFTTAPAIGTNTVKITAYKTNASDALQIKNCTLGIEFSSRLFITGNPNYPNRLWKTGLTANQTPVQANYFPASGLSSFDAVTGIDQKMVAFSKKLDKLIYLKERSTHITYNQTQADGTSGFPISAIDETKGCDMPGSVQVVNGCPVFFNTYNGGNMIISANNVLGENQIKDISVNINGTSLRPGLLQESPTDLLNCSSYNDGSKYYLNVGNHTYVWDYSLGYDLNNPESLHWFIYDTIQANNFLSINNVLCYADSKIGRVVKQIDALNYFGNPISAKFRASLMDFKHAEWYKNITEIWLTTRSNSDSTLTINYYDDNGQMISSSTIPKTSTKSFSWSNWVWSTFTWAYQKFAPTIRFKPGIKNVRYFQLEITNNNFNEDLSIVSIVIKYTLTRRVR
jgi:hypothetical protein